eukprot:SM000054S18152  [mRNA]  locus=s54:647260:652178:- [translate_table: standard]
MLRGMGLQKGKAIGRNARPGAPLEPVEYSPQHQGFASPRAAGRWRPQRPPQAQPPQLRHGSPAASSTRLLQSLLCGPCKSYALCRCYNVIRLWTVVVRRPSPLAVPATSGAAARCNACEKDFPSAAQLATHVGMHQRCGRDGCTFEATGKMLKEHSVTVHGEKSPLSALAQRAALRRGRESAEDIEQWRRERRQQYPTAANVRRKMDAAAERRGGGASEDSEAALRKKRLREVLAKQAELGVPVAEIPPWYVQDGLDRGRGEGGGGRGRGRGRGFRGSGRGTARHEYGTPSWGRPAAASLRSDDGAGSLGHGEALLLEGGEKGRDGGGGCVLLEEGEAERKRQRQASPARPKDQVADAAAPSVSATVDERETATDAAAEVGRGNGDCQADEMEVATSSAAIDAPPVGTSVSEVQGSPEGGLDSKSASASTGEGPARALVPQQAPDSRARLCYFYRRGRCRKGSRCNFSHQLHPGGDSSGPKGRQGGDGGGGRAAFRRGAAAMAAGAPPSLLAKLLAPEIQQDRSYLLQAFRFFVDNGFFSKPTGTALKLPAWADDGPGETARQSLKPGEAATQAATGARNTEQLEDKSIELEAEEEEYEDEEHEEEEEEEEDQEEEEEEEEDEEDEEGEAEAVREGGEEDGREVISGEEREAGGEVATVAGTGLRLAPEVATTSCLDELRTMGSLMDCTQYGPEYGHIKDGEEVPELELRQPADEGLELVAALGGQRGALDLGVDLRRQKANEQVEDVDAEAVSHDVEALLARHCQANHVASITPPTQRPTSPPWLGDEPLG